MEPTTVRAERELLVTDPYDVGGARADSAKDDAPWSFRFLVEQLAPPAKASEMVLAWLDSWSATSVDHDGATLPMTKRDAVASSLVCPWLRLSPANGCDATCGTCAARVLDLSRAPFKLLAIVNRIDLAETDEGCDPPSAEARFVFVATSPETGKPISFNAIFEYKVDGTPAGTPEAWHALGALRDEPYAIALERLTRSFSSRGGKLGQIRTSENLAGEATGSAWELREFQLRDTKLANVPVTNTPRDGLDGTPALRDHINANMADIMSGRNAITPAISTAFTTMRSADFKWSAPDVAEFQLRLFGLSTCNGCHAGERGDTTVLPFAHIGVDASGATIVSRFLRDPDQQDGDELSFRARSLMRRLQGQCGGGDASYASRHGGGIPVPPVGRPPSRVH